MKAGYFNIHEYLEKLYENAQEPMMDGGTDVTNQDGVLMPDTNVKAYQWLKKEYQRAQTEVKVEINMGGAKFEPGYDLQTDLKSVKDFKPGMFGQVKTADTPSTAKDDKKAPSSLDSKKDKPGFQPGESEKEEKEETPKTKAQSGDIKNKKEHEAGESKEKEEKEEHEAGESKEKEEKEEKKEPKEGEAKVKKLDLKTKKK